MNAKEKVFKGIPAASGLAMGKAFRLESEKLNIPRFTPKDPENELNRLAVACRQAADELDKIQLHAARHIGESEAALFEAHKMFLEDLALLEMVESVIRKGQNVEAAWVDTIEQFAVELAQLPDPTLSERAADIRDVGRRVLRLLLGWQNPQALHFDHPVILIAKDLEPSQTAVLDKNMVLAFCTSLGGPTSHTAILAKVIGIPAVVGLGEALLDIEPDTLILVDGSLGQVIAQPGEAARTEFEQKQLNAKKTASNELEQAHLPAVTLDHHQVEVVCNIGSLTDAQTALLHGAEGIGLLRTEFLYLNRSVAPTEEEQFEAYKVIFETMGSMPVVARTLDAGGDKQIPYLNLANEANPFLGLRAIRLCLERPELFKMQLRALLRAGEGHDLRIMFPMVADLSEVRQAKHLLAEAQAELSAAGNSGGFNFQTGIMVEIPSVVWMVNAFTSEVDFFSIGTNDLTQYTFAAERTNEHVAYLSDACHPAVLRQIHHVINIAHQAGKWVGVCGELAGEEDAIPILLGMGVDEFSMASSSIPHAKMILRSWYYKAAQDLAKQVLKLDSAVEVREFVRRKAVAVHGL